MFCIPEVDKKRQNRMSYKALEPAELQIYRHFFTVLNLKAEF